MRLRPLFLPALLLVAGPAAGQGDPDVVARIIAEGKDNSQVWETLRYLSEDIGPRLTGSFKLQRANTWTRDEFQRLGLKNAHLAKWGDIPVRFDRGPCYARMIVPEEKDFEFTARAWSAGTDGPVRGPVILMPATMEELEAVRGELEGAWILSQSTRRSRRRGGDSEEDDDARKAREQREAVTAAIDEAPIAGKLTSSRNDLVITGGERGWRELTMDTLPEGVNVSICRTDYEAMEALLKDGKEVEVEVDLVHYFSEGPFPVFNTVAEIPGTEKPDEVIILSAHLDSWDGPGSDGTQDNGTGTSVMIEAARILMAAGVQPKRTIRFCLWTGEEQGLYGSRAYVETMSDEERAKISAAFVDDGGTNYQGGLVCVAAMEPMLEAAIAPLGAAFPDYEVLNVVRDEMPRGGASDHASFNRAGIPGFFWIEKGTGGREEKNYTFVHHTQHDTMRYAVEEYLVQSAVCSAVTAYNLAQADTMLPRYVASAEAEAPVVDASFVVTPGPITGKWECELTGPEAPDLAFTLTLEMAKDNRLRGSLKSPMGEAKIAEGTWDAETKKAKFIAESDMGKLEMEGELEDAVLKGQMTVGGGAMISPFVARRPPTIETPISGTWKALLIERDSEFRMHFEVAPDGAVSGWFKSSSSDSPLFGGRWEAQESKITFEYDYPNAGRLPVEGKIDGDELTGTIAGRMEFKASREGKD